MLGYILPED